MRSKLSVTVFSLCCLACAHGTAQLRDELRAASASAGLALAEDLGGNIVVIPFDGPERYFDSEYRFPIGAFGKAGRMVMWWSQRGLLDYRGTFAIDSTGDGTITGQTSQAGFHPIALSEAAGRMAFFTSEGPGSTVLRWASFDMSAGGVVGWNTGYPDWSPDGNALVYEKEGRVFRFDVTSGLSTVLAAGLYPTWNADGSAVSFVARDGSAALMTPAGASANWPLGGFRPVGPLQWSPDGRFVSFPEKLATLSSFSGTSYQLVVCRVSDGQRFTVRKFGFGMGDYANFHWILRYRDFCLRCTPTPTAAR